MEILKDNHNQSMYTIYSLLLAMQCYHVQCKCVYTQTYNWIGEVIEWFMSQAPYLIENHPITPNVTRPGVLLVVQSLVKYETKEI